MNRFSTFFAVSALVLFAYPAAGQNASELSADLPDPQVLRIQRKVEKLFVADEYERALFIYINELAPIGDKYAQYMVGYMLEMGLGAEKDVVAASAWYRLASERDTPEFVQIRDKTLSALTDRQRAQSDVIYSGLRRTYGDMAVLMASIKRDYEQIAMVTGSRVGGSGGSPVTIIDPRSGSARTLADVNRDVERRMYDRISMLTALGGFRELGDDPSTVNIRELERLVDMKLASLPD